MEKIISLLKQFGFTENDAKVYIALLKNGECTGYEASKLSGVPRSKVYGDIERLINRGAIEICGGDKTPLYRAQPVERLTMSIRNHTDDLLTELRDEAGKYSSPRDDEKLWQIEEYDSIIAKALEMIEGAESQISIQIWMEDLDSRIEDALNRKFEEIDDMLVVLYDITGRYECGLKKFYKHGFEYRRLQDVGHRWLTLACDRSEVLYSSVTNRDAAEAMYTRNRSMVFFADEYVYHDAACLRLIDRLRPEITKEFGDVNEVLDVLDY
jgi:sugar-specific transcriptional regulator TrmB